MKWLIVVVKIANLISTHAIRLAIRASKIAIKTLSAIFSLKVFIYDWTRVYNVVDFKNIRFQSSTQIHQTRRIQKIKIHPGDWGAVSKMCGFTGFVWMECRFIQKTMRFQKYLDSRYMPSLLKSACLKLISSKIIAF